MNPNEYVTLQKDRHYLSLWNGFVPSKDVITVAGLEYIKNNMNMLTNEEQIVVSNVCKLFDGRSSQTMTMRMKKNDYPPNVKLNIFGQTPLEYFDVLKVAWRKTHTETKSLTFKRLNDDLALANGMKPFLTIFEKICEKMEVTFQKDALLSLINIQKNIDKGSVSIRSEKDAVNKIATEIQAFVVADETGFFSSGYSKPLDEAKLFFSEEEAKKSMKKSNWEGHSAIVSVTIALNKKVYGLHLDTLEDALALQQKKRIQETLEQMEIEQLRARLSELENKYNEKPVEKVKQKRKM